MSNKDVGKVEFWKKRIETAQREHFSVYVMHEAGWDNLNRYHKEVFQKHIPRDAKVLDAGCGYGRWSYFFSDYTGVDFSPDFISKAKGKFPDKNFIQSKLEELPFKDKEFDWAFCVSIKQMIVANLGPEVWNLMENELRRVAKKILILEYNAEEYEII